jgi:hypothetical protein
MQLYKQQQQVELMQRQEHQSKLELDQLQLQAFLSLWINSWRIKT